MAQIQQTDLVSSGLETGRFPNSRLARVPARDAARFFSPLGQHARRYFAALLCADAASAQEAGGGRALIDLSASFGVGLVVIGAAKGISKLAAAAYESMARQPEVSGSIQTALIIAAALIEGLRSTRYSSAQESSLLLSITVFHET